MATIKPHRRCDDKAQHLHAGADKTGHLHSLEPMQTIKPGRALLTWLEPDAAHEPALMAEGALAQEWLNPDIS